MTLLNKIALAKLVLAKIFGTTGIVLGFDPGLHKMGGMLLILAAVFLAATVAICLFQMYFRPLPEFRHD